MAKVWIDADACPKVVKELIFKACEKQRFPVVLVANQNMAIPRLPQVSLIVVEKIFDEADNYILENGNNSEIVISADIPLAAKLVEKGLVVITPRGKVYNKSNVMEALSMRNLMEEFRGGGMIQGGPPAYGAKDKQNFANSFQAQLAKMLAK